MTINKMKCLHGRISAPSNSRLMLPGPNPRKWGLTDLENWFETEGGINRRDGRVNFTQKDKECLDKICEALREELGVVRCPIHELNHGSFQIQLPIDESARFLVAMKHRVKTKKAYVSLQELERCLRRPRKALRKVTLRVYEILRKLPS
jgi:hypothetical protein